MSATGDEGRVDARAGDANPSRDAIPDAVVELLSSICGAVQIGDLDGGIPTIEGTVDRDGQSWMCQTSVYSEGAILLTNSIWAEQVPPGRRPEVRELIGAVNWALLTGNAEMDDQDGTVRLRTSLYCAGEAVPMPLAEGLVLPNLGAAALVFPCVASVASGAAEPGDAAEQLIGEIESGRLVLRR